MESGVRKIMRIKNAFRNSFFSVISQIILIVVGFFSQRVMNLRMGEELVGMNSVISNIIALLSVSELGISTAVVFHLYSALADGDEKRISSLMNLYRKAYYVFATVISVLGLIVLPFVHLFLRENSFSLGYVRTIYILWLARTVLSYLLSYKRSILIADQQEYIVSIGTLLANALNYGLIIVIVEIWQNYVLALSLNIAVEVILNALISRYVGKKYPYLKTFYKLPLEKNIVKKVLGDLKNIFVSRLSAKLLLCTDSLIMSSFISVGIVGLYSNYTMITQSLTNIVVAFTNALQPSVGNMFIERDHEKEYGVLRQITFIFFLFSSFAVSSLFALMTPFVTDIWLDREYALGLGIILWCVINFYFSTMGQPLGMMMNVTGLFDKERNLSIIVAIVNLLISLLLVGSYGVPGVLLGTFVSYVIQMVFRIYMLVGKYMGKGYKQYILESLQYIFLAAVETALVYGCKQLVYESGNILSFILLMFICVLVPNGINVLLFCRTWRFKSVYHMLKELLWKR